LKDKPIPDDPQLPAIVDLMKACVASFSPGPVKHTFTVDGDGQ
jgi:hypothetical protein